MMELNEAKNIYTGIEAYLEPVAERIAIAGSARREKAIVKDLEIVMITNPVKDLLNQDYYTSDLVRAKLEKKYLALNGGTKYIRFESYGQPVDLFITTPNQWGLIYAIRTGSADFSRWLVTPRQKGGALPSNYSVKDGWLMQGSKKIPVPSEEYLFEVLGIRWIEPTRREGAPGLIEMRKLYK